MSGQHEEDEYLDQDEAERDDAGRRNSLIALVVLAVLVVTGLVLVDRLSSVSALQDCLMSHATNCATVSPPPSAAPAVQSGASTTR
ncbi:hypothetical protein [Reyranella soli]|jgi:hypothetical protein|uniref:Uncharacterized protein n=1 Tax=Reyranella soli TaxID=1230389 RepID=A0A512NCK1_9HYPH|nr:hypothetical protein [Reyranella soli]GEP56677.1 hypothetical protein RSO01_38430 [Reyranella soli]